MSKFNQYVQYAQDSDNVFGEETYGNLRKSIEKFLKSQESKEK